MEKFGLQLSKDEEEVIRLRRDERGSLVSISEQVYDGAKTRQAVLQTYQRAKEKKWRLEASERYKGKEALCPIDELPLPARARNALTRAGFQTIGQVAGKSDKDLLDLPGLGPDCLAFLRGMMEEWGLVKSGKIKKRQNQQAAPAAAAGEGSEKPKQRRVYHCTCGRKFSKPWALKRHEYWKHDVSGAADTTALHVSQIAAIMRDGKRLSFEITRLYNEQVAGYAVGSDGRFLKDPKGKKKLVVTLVGKILP